MRVDRATDRALAWLRCGPAYDWQLHERMPDYSLRTVRGALKDLHGMGLIEPDGPPRGHVSRAWAIVDDPERWRAVKWLCGQPRLRVSELYGYRKSGSDDQGSAIRS